MESAFGGKIIETETGRYVRLDEVQPFIELAQRLYQDRTSGERRQSKLTDFRVEAALALMHSSDWRAHPLGRFPETP